MADLFYVPYVRAVWRMLVQRLREDGRMAVFGAGAHTRWLLSVTSDLPCPPIDCIIDDQSELATLGPYDVRRPAEVDVSELDLILISSDRWEDELADRALALWDNRIELVRLYRGLPRGPYDKTDDYTETLQHLRQRAPGGPVGHGLVVIVSDQPRSREAKIGYALRGFGCRPVLLHRRAPTFDTSRFFDCVRRFGHEWECLRIACDYAPVAYHVMVDTDYRLASLFVRHRPGVVVVDSSDLVAGMYTDEFLAAHRDFAQEIPRERYCLQHADGLCSRSRELDVLEHDWGYQLAPSLSMPDGCWNQPAAAASPPSRGLHIACVGKLHAGPGGSERFAACACNLPLARSLADQGIHLHAYPSPGQTTGREQDTLAEYRALARTHCCFHMHDPLPPDQLTGALSQCHLAMSVYPELVIPTGTPQGFRPEKLRHCTANTFFDYTDAGLPILHNTAPDSYLSGLLREHGTGIDAGTWPIHEWGHRLRQLDLAPLRHRAAQAREAYDVRHAAGALTAFYGRLRDDAISKDMERPTRLEEPSVADRRDKCRPALV